VARGEQFTWRLTLGWMYVVKRATLLHDSVRRGLLQRMPSIRHATTYLAAAGSVAGMRWQSFGNALDGYVVNADISKRVMSAADHAFRRWRDWVDVNQPARSA
jgi:heme oxygenase